MAATHKSVAPAELQPISAAEADDKRKKAKFAKVQMQTRIGYCVMVAGAYPFLPSNDALYGLFPAFLLHNLAFRLLLLFGQRGNQDYAIACKRILSMLAGFVTGLPGLVVALRYNSDPSLIALFSGVQIGLYMADMWFLTEQQAAIPALIGHHFLTSTCMFAFLVARDYQMNFIGLIVELTNPAWYANVLLKTWIKAGDKVMDWSRTVNMYVYLVVRFVWATHECYQIASPKFLVWPPNVVGALYAVLLVGFTYVNTNNFVKLIQSGFSKKPAESSSHQVRKHQ